MNPKIITLNMRGTNEVEKRMQIRGRLREWKADIVCLQETFIFGCQEPLQGRAFQTHSCRINFSRVHRTLESFPTRN